MHLACPAFVHVQHVPGLELTRTTTDVAGLHLRRLSWIEWRLLEHGATAEALMREYEQGLHSFAVVIRPDFQGDQAAASALAADDATSLRRLVTSLRLVKPGDLMDPATSVRYEGRGPDILRTSSSFGREFFELKFARRYLLRDEDATMAESLAADLAQLDATGDRTIQLAVRHFNASYGHAMDREERLLHLFTSLEATFGEYKRHARPVVGVSLGKTAAVLWPRATRRSIAAFLDGGTEARGLRNAVAHGEVGGRTTAQLDSAIDQLREVIRIGLRNLLRLFARQAELTAQLEGVSIGLGTLPPKTVFQHVLGHAANRSPEGEALLAGLFQ